MTEIFMFGQRAIDAKNPGRREADHCVTFLLAETCERLFGEVAL